MTICRIAKHPPLNSKNEDFIDQPLVDLFLKISHIWGQYPIRLMQAFIDPQVLNTEFISWVQTDMIIITQTPTTMGEIPKIQDTFSLAFLGNSLKMTYPQKQNVIPTKLKIRSETCTSALYCDLGLYIPK